MVHVKFGLIWRASSDVFDFTTDVNTGALAKSLAKASWNGYLPSLEKLYGAMNFYAQGGTLNGTLSIDGNEEIVYLFGERMRLLGSTSFLNKAEFSHFLGETYHNGRLVHIVKASIANVVENLTFGFVIQLSGTIDGVKDTSIDIANLSDEEEAENDVEIKFHADDERYELKGTLAGKETQVQAKKAIDCHLTIDCLNFELNSIKGSGIVINGKITKPTTKRVTFNTPLYQAPSVIPLVVHFSDKFCQHLEITGGKGSSLGKLTELSKDFQNFVVPKGLVVTTAAYEKFVTQIILKEIQNLESVLYNNTPGNAKEMCQRVMDEVVKSTIPDEVLDAMVTNLKLAFPDRKHLLKFAVRSSATGEDTEQMSAAGQMDTFLGVTGMNEIVSSVKKCWASQFSYIAVQYKRQNGQILNSPMAVVIQEMISCDVAGVLFTCDPLTGNPTTMSITANYGLGESVVSGAEEPDTIEIERTSDGQLQIKKKLIGSKGRRIIMRDEGGTDLQDVSEHEKGVCCLTDEMSLRLSSVAVKIEKSYRSHRDIEWGYWNNNLYIFQSRPVTSGNGESDFEIDHEFDAPLRNENEYFTVANVGEVMPGAMSPLGIELVLKFANIIFQRKRFVDFQQSIRNTYFPRGMIQMCNHCMFYLIDLFNHINDNPEMADLGAVGLFGRLIEDEEMFAMARERHAKTKGESFTQNLKRLSRVLYFANQWLERTQKAYANYRIPIENYDTAPELFDALLKQCTGLSGSFGCHMVCSETSSLWNMIIFVILRKAKGELTADVYTDFAHLLTTSSEVESADVPAAIESLAFHISKDIKPEDFKKMNTKEAKEWLETSPSVSGTKYRGFLTRHGHRCLKEFDIRSIPWGRNSETLIPFLQNLVGSVKKDKAEKVQQTFKETIAGLRITLDFKTRLAMRFAIPMSRKAVQNRESSKSLLIKGMDSWRKGYTRLAKLMVSEGRLPEEDLLFFMTLEEIQELLRSRSPKIIFKASRRRRRHPILDNHIFPEIMKGFPEPINMDISPTTTADDNLSMKGIPVSQGVRKGFVRVALNLEEASLLQPGEILVTYSTDIGWSPYFPILGGVVTELGGLLSHGAVVSREYGIPCIAGLHGATRQFVTGDYAILDGNKGVLQKLPKPEVS